MKNKSSIPFTLILLSLLSTSCHKSVFVQEDHLGSSRFTLYKENYLYREKTRHSDLKILGKYYLTDSTIVFEWKEKGKIPYNYLRANVTKSFSNKGKDHITLTILDKETNHPIPFPTVRVLDINGKVLENISSNIEGIVSIDKKDKIALIEVSFIGYATTIIDYRTYLEHDLAISMEALPPGGRLTEGCIIA